jgi:hypothetical protein
MTQHGRSTVKLQVGSFRLGGRAYCLMFMSDWSALMTPKKETLNSLRTFSSYVLHRPSWYKSRQETVTVTIVNYPFSLLLLHGRCCKACVTMRSIKLLYLAHFSHVGTLIYCIGRCYFTADLGSLRHHREHGWNSNVAVINNLIFTWFFNKLFLITQPILVTASQKIWYFHLLSWSSLETRSLCDTFQFMLW